MIIRTIKAARASEFDSVLLQHQSGLVGIHGALSVGRPTPSRTNRVRPYDGFLTSIKVKGFSFTKMANIDSEEDDDLKRAIAMSLEEFKSSPTRDQTTSTRPKQSIINLLSDDEVEITKAVSKHSKISSLVPRQIKDVTDLTGSASGPSNIQPMRKVQGLFGNSSSALLDRRKMEEERLARLKGKRRISISPPPLKRAKQATSSNGNSRSIADLAETPSPAFTNTNTNTNTYPATPHGLGIQYPKGVVKKTWVYGCERKGDDIKIEEVLQKVCLVDYSIAPHLASSWGTLMPGTPTNLFNKFCY
jgi:Ubiquitin interaction motif